MVQAASPSFRAARNAPVNVPTYKVILDRGNYAWSGEGGVATATSEFSADFPASGANNGDRTHLNYGPAATAENDVGKSGWKALNVASGGSPERLTVAFGVTRTISKIVLYFHPTLADGVPANFTVETSPDGVTFTAQATGTGNTARKFVATFPDLTASHIRVSVTSASGDGRPVILEAEAYLAVDISRRVMSIRLQRNREFTQNRYLASEVSMTVSNVDLFFSPRYVPKTTDVGFFNSEWRPNLPFRVSIGFNNENLQQFEGVLDRIEQDAGTRTAVLKGRDRLKQALQRKVSTKLQTGLSLEAAVTRLLNLANIPTQEIVTDVSTITFAHFFPQDVNIYDEIQRVLQSAGDAVLYVDETGTVQFKMFLNSVPQSFIWDSQADWEQAGTTSQNISTTDAPGDLRVKDLTTFGHTTDAFTYTAAALPEASTPVWTLFTSTAFLGVIEARNVTDFPGDHRVRLFAGNGTLDEATVRYTRSEVTTFQTPGFSITIRFRLTTANADRFGHVFLRITHRAGITNFDIKPWINSGTLSGEGLAGADFALANLSDGNYHTIKMEWTRHVQTVTIFYDNANVGSGSFTAPAVDPGTTVQWRFNIAGSEANGGDRLDVRVDQVDWDFDNKAVQGEWISQEVDLTTRVESYDRLDSFETPSAFVSQYFLRVADVSGGPYTEFSITPQTPISGVPVKRFVKIRALLKGDVSAALLAATPVVAKMEFFWFTSAGSAKFPASAAMTIRSSDILTALRTSLTDETGGSSPIITKSVVKANPFYLAVAASTAWEATVGGTVVSGGNPLVLPVGVTEILVDYGDHQFNIPQTVNMTVSSGAATATLTSHTNKPILRINVTSVATITLLNITGTEFIQRGTFIVVSQAEDKFLQEFAVREEDIENDYIQNSNMAKVISGTRVAAFKRPQEVVTVDTRLVPDLQLQDRVTVGDVNTGTRTEYQMAGMVHELAVSGDALVASTQETLIALPEQRAPALLPAVIYEGDVIPSADASPWTLLAGASGSDALLTDGGRTVLEMTAATPGTRFWRRTTDVAPNAGGNIVEWVMRDAVTGAGGMSQVEIRDGVRAVRVEIHRTLLRVFDAISGSSAPDVGMDNSTFHRFRLEVKGATALVFVDGSATAAVTHTLTGTTTEVFIQFGLNNLPGNARQPRWDQIAYGPLA